MAGAGNRRTIPSAGACGGATTKDAQRLGVSDDGHILSWRAGPGTSTVLTLVVVIASDNICV